MGRQSIRALVILMLLAVLSGIAVLVYASLSSTFSYSIQSNIDSNRDYYPSMTQHLEKRTEPHTETSADE